MLRGLNENRNHDLKTIFKSAATRASSCAGPFQDFYQGAAGQRNEETRRERSCTPLSLLPLEPRENLSDGGAAGACTRAGSIHADHAGLIGVVHILSGGGRSDRLGCYRIRLIGRTRGERKRVAALLAG